MIILKIEKNATALRYKRIRDKNLIVGSIRKFS